MSGLLEGPATNYHHFRIHGRPASKQQVRVTGRGAFQSKAYRAWHAHALLQINSSPFMVDFVPTLTADLYVRITVCRKIPDHIKGDLRDLLMGAYCSVGLDWDNAAKAVCDPFNGAVWVDDKQIVQAHVTKLWAQTDYVELSVQNA